jgi:transcriptional regulator with XRE-family HTH domain
MTDPNDVAVRSKTLGAVMRNARKARGKSQKETAALIGVSSGMLSSYERGLKMISLPELELLALTLEFPLKYFLDPDPDVTFQKTVVNPEMLLTLRRRIIGAQLRAHRMEIGLSIRKLAKQTGLPASRISAYERGLRKIPLNDLESLAQALGHYLEEYIADDGPIAERETNLQVLELFSNLPPDLRDFLSKPINEPYLRLAKQLSELSVEKLRTVAEGLLEITL